MSSGAGRDAWLYSGRRIRKSAIEEAAAAGRREGPASDLVARSLAPRITNWGGDTNPRNPDSVASVLVRKSAPFEYPESRQLKDPFDTLYTQGIALEPPLQPDRLLNLTEENPLHSSCLMAKAVDSCGRGWEFKPKDGKKGEKSLMESELPNKLKEGMELLTPDLTFGEMLYQAAWEKEAIGWAVWEAVRMMDQYTPGKFAPIGALYPIPSFTIRATVDPRRWVQIRAGRVRFFKKFGAKCDIDSETGQIFDWKEPKDLERLGNTDPMRLGSEFIIFKEYTPRSLWYGIPKWISAVPTIAELSAIREFNVSWFASGGQTDYIIHFRGETLEVAQKMADDVRTEMRENQGRGHTNLVVAGTSETEMDVQKLGELLREGHFRFRRGDLAKEVLIAHSVPPYRIGWAETGSLGGNAAVEMLGAYKFGAIQPIQAVIEDRLRMTLFDPNMGLNTGDFRFKLQELELDDMEKEITRVTSLVKSGLMTPNQGREELGLDPVEKVKGAPKLDAQGKPVVNPKTGETLREQPKMGPDGKPMLDEQGKPIMEPAQQVEQVPEPEIGPDGKPILDENGKPVMKPAMGEEQPEPEVDENGKPVLDENGQPVMKPRVKKAFPPKPQAPQVQGEQPADGTQPGKDDMGANMNGMPGQEDTDEGQVEAMNTYYWNGQPLSAKPAAPKPTIGPDGKPMMFGKPVGPDGSPAPDAGEKPVDKTAMDVIGDFEKVLRASLREQPAAGRESDSAPSADARPSRSRPAAVTRIRRTS